MRGESYYNYYLLTYYLVNKRRCFEFWWRCESCIVSGLLKGSVDESLRVVLKCVLHSSYLLVFPWLLALAFRRFDWLDWTGSCVSTLCSVMCVCWWVKRVLPSSKLELYNYQWYFRLCLGQCFGFCWAFGICWWFVFKMCAVFIDRLFTWVRERKKKEKKGKK